MRDITFKYPVVFVDFYNKIRRENKDKWIGYGAIIAGRHVYIKSYNTWTQVIDIEGVRDSGRMDLNVTQWKDELLKWLTV